MRHTIELVFPPSIGIIHFIGIGGIGMSGIAEILFHMGFQVQGSDLSNSYVTDRLEKLGIKIYYQQGSKNVESASLVIRSTAIKDFNPEIHRAAELGIPIIKRSQMLAEIMRFKHSIAISGTHGKTTTTSLVAHLLDSASLDPTVINGGIINSKNTNAYIGSGAYLVAEADESDGTFINIPNYISVITNINPEHLDYYENFENVISAYRKFITNLPFYGFAVLCYDHPTVKQLGTSIKNRRVISYGLDSNDVDLRAVDIRTSITGSTFNVQLSDSYRIHKRVACDVINNIELHLNGRHNISNCLAAIAIGIELGIDLDVITKSFTAFHGVKRRFTKVGEVNGISIIDDYAHHPNEIKATLLTARELTQPNNARVIAVVQPHRYSRLKDLLSEFVEALSIADCIIVADVYAAGEDPIVGINSPYLVQRLKSYGSEQAIYLDQPENLPELINKLAKSPDIVIFLGAGNITKWAYELPTNLQKLQDANT